MRANTPLRPHEQVPGGYSPYPSVQSFELAIAGYFAVTYFKEILQLGLSMLTGSGFIDGLSDYFFDFWNILDQMSVVSFAVGLYQRYECTLHGPVCVWMELHESFPTAATSNSTAPASNSTAAARREGPSEVYPSPWELWSACYAMSLLCGWFRVLRSFYLSNLGLIVSIFLAMVKDVAQFVVFYVILVLAMSMVFLGVWEACAGICFARTHCARITEHP